MRDNLENHYPGFQYLGTADSSLLYHPKQLNLQFPDTHIIVIERDIKDVVHSMTKNNMLGSLTPKQWEKAFQALVNRWKEKSKNSYYIPYKYLQLESTIKELHTICTPNTTYSQDRWLQLDKLNVQLTSKEIDRSYSSVRHT